MEEAILKFPEQFRWQPKIENISAFSPKRRLVVGGMGGSNLATGILKMWQPKIEIYSHRSYGLPPFEDEFLKESLLVASSYSGNTEETLDFLEEGYDRGFKMVVIATGGLLIDFARENNLPFIQIPNDGIQPRTAVGYSLLALAKFLSIPDLAKELSSIADILNPNSLREQGEMIAKSIFGKIPVIYSSNENSAVAYNWKIKMNETAKIPAFYNVFPELNHNEMTGFDLNEKNKDSLGNFSFVFIKDSEDHPQIQKRMDVCEKMYEERGLTAVSVFLSGNNILHKALNSIILADWVALALAKSYGSEPEQVPIIEEFKKRIK